MKKTISLVLTVLFLSTLGRAQEMSKCASTKAMIKKSATDQNFAKRVAETSELREKLNSFKTAGGSNIYIIPVVFHILHLNGSENISNAQVYDAVAHMNKDFRKKNADTIDIVPEFIPIAADCEIEFRLATLDPDGNCTNGIIRHYTTSTNFDASYQYTGVGPGLWDPQKYMSIYVCKTLDFPGAAAYTYLPGWLGAGNPMDAIVAQNSYVGGIGTASPIAIHVLSHEVGHWLGLDHVWGGTNDPGVACGDDGVFDTPITKGWSSCNLSSNQVCTPGITENVQNFMEYSYCDNMFTAGQKQLMKNVIATGSNAGRDILVSPSNLLATGVTNPQVCPPVADFITVNNKYNYCTGQSIQFRDNTLNSYPTSWNWNFPGGTPSTSTDSMPTVSYASPGVYAVSYTATNTAGTSNMSKNNYITVVNGTADYSSVYNEGFEMSTIPGIDWTTENSLDANTWIETSTTASSGTKSAMINNVTNTNGNIEVLYSPSFDLNAINSSNPTVAFTFKLAYQKATTNANEKLQVFSSTNCGQTWLQRYSKSASNLATVASVSPNAFVPSSASDWRTETVSVNAINNQTNVFFKFVFTADAAGNKNNIYIDDINIAQTTVGINEQYENTLNPELFPNPSKEKTTIQFTLTKTSDISLKVLDLLGKEEIVVAHKELSSGEQKLDLHHSSRSAGVYFVVLSINGEQFIKKMIVE